MPINDERVLPVIQEGGTNKQSIMLDLGDHKVSADAVFYVPSVQPNSSGPWTQEADKIAWTDEMSGDGCIIRRSPHGDHLGGYVLIPPDHPFYRLPAEALVGTGVRLEHPIDYADECERGVREEVSICQVNPRPDLLAWENPFFSNEASEHNEAWWFGF